MEKQIEKFDPSKLMEGVKDRIKATFVSLIPDDAWEKMVEKEIYIFTEGRIKIERKYIDGQYQDTEVREPYKQAGFVGLDNLRDEDISPLQKMIREELRERFKQNLVEFLQSEEYQGYWGQYGRPLVGDAVKKVLTENADTIFVNFMGSMMQMAIESMRSQIVSDLTQKGYRGY